MGMVVDMIEAKFGVETRRIVLQGETILTIIIRFTIFSTRKRHRQGQSPQWSG